MYLLQSSNNIELKDIIALILSGFAFLVSVVSFLWNRHYARTLFETTNFPDLELSIEHEVYNEANFLHYEGKAVYSIGGVRVEVRNRTKVPAVNIMLRFTMTSGWKHITWEEQPSRWEKLPELGTAAAISGVFIDIAAIRLRPENYAIRNVPPQDLKPNEIGFDTIVLESKTPTLLPAFPFIIECSWEPPLRIKRTLKTYQTFVLEPSLKNATNSIKWSIRPKPTKQPLWLLTRRPITLKLS